MTWMNTIDIDSCGIQDSHRAIDIHYYFVSKTWDCQAIWRIGIKGRNMIEIMSKAYHPNVTLETPF